MLWHTIRHIWTGVSVKWKRALLKITLLIVQLWSVTKENERTASSRELILVSSSSLHLDHLCKHLNIELSNLITKHMQYHEKISCDVEKKSYIITSSLSFLSQVVTSLNLLPCSVPQLLLMAETDFFLYHFRYLHPLLVPDSGCFRVHIAC